MEVYLVVKTVHIICVIFFIGVVSFRTFIVVDLKKQFDLTLYKKIDNLLGKKARSIIKINNVFLIITGIYLATYYFQIGIGLVLWIKIGLGAILALTFYIVPLIMAKMKNVAWFNMFFHHLFFTLMMITVVLSQFALYI